MQILDRYLHQRRGTTIKTGLPFTSREIIDSGRLRPTLWSTWSLISCLSIFRLWAPVLSRRLISDEGGDYIRVPLFLLCPDLLRLARQPAGQGQPGHRFSRLANATCFYPPFLSLFSILDFDLIGPIPFVRRLNLKHRSIFTLLASLFLRK